MDGRFTGRAHAARAGDGHGGSGAGLAAGARAGAGRIRSRRREEVEAVVFVVQSASSRRRLQKPQLFSFRSRISPTSAGFALPLLSFITWPLRKFNAAVLPDLKSFAGPGLVAMTSSQNFSIAPVSLTSPRFFSW